MQSNLLNGVTCLMMLNFLTQTNNVLNENVHGVLCHIEFKTDT